MAQINFKGKTFVQNHHLAVKFHQLVPDKNKSQTDKLSLHDNLIVHGDNLKALKALMPTYAGKVKCIYIDPPYNTGNEGWVYSDSVNSPLIQEWMKEAKPVDKEDLTRHDKWLCMMMPRMRLLKELLSEDGVIFVSIDDNEQHRLRMLMDEIFGEDNFVTNIIWQKKYSPQNDAKYFSDMHDFIVVYAKHKNVGDEKNGWIRNLISRNETQNARYKNPDNDPRGPWKPADVSVKTYSKDYDYAITTPSGRIVRPPQGRCWSTSISNFEKWRNDNRIWFGKDGGNVPSVKIFLSEVQDGVVPTTIWLRDEVGDNEYAKKEIKGLFGDVQLAFETPKPTTLIKKILQLASGKNDLILDSFAGSGTTAHAVLDLNKEDGGNRKFILVEMEDYAHTITAERVRRVIKSGTPGTFSYFELGEPVELENILSGKSLPSYTDLARYVFYTATGEEFDESKINEGINYIGESKEYEVFLFYKPDLEYLKATALTLDRAEKLQGKSGKKKLVFAPTKYIDQDNLDRFNIVFAQLPFEIYKLAK